MGRDNNCKKEFLGSLPNVIALGDGGSYSERCNRGGCENAPGLVSLGACIYRSGVPTHHTCTRFIALIWSTSQRCPFDGHLSEHARLLTRAVF